MCRDISASPWTGRFNLFIIFPFYQDDFPFAKHPCGAPAGMCGCKGSGVKYSQEYEYEKLETHYL
jgi:hypothetical protein